ncbi:MAG: twin-arginine translocase TatA/TatE family subunit [Nitrospiraceae bacterium]|nr:twin-arginine translocase TatA/TatE family subunit [Nitrospiraceae bacterium]
MFGDIQEILVIFLVALLVVGPKKLPEVARKAGRILGQIRRALMEARLEIDRELRAEEEVEREPGGKTEAQGPGGGAASAQKKETAAPQEADGGMKAEHTDIND